MSRLLLILFALASLALPLTLPFAQPFATAQTADPRGEAAVVFAPWTSQAEAFARIGESGGAIVRAGALPFVAIAVAEDGPAFARAVRAAGALALLDPGTLASCITPARAI